MPPRSTKGRPRAPNSGGLCGCGIVKLTFIALTLTPIFVLFTMIYHGRNLFQEETKAQDAKLAPGKQLGDPEASHGSFASDPGSGHVHPAFHQELGRGGQRPGRSNPRLRSGGGGSGAALKDDVWGNATGHDDAPSSAESRAAAFEEKRAFIGSEPMSGNWLLDCPPKPWPGYPEAYPIMDIVNNWGPDRPTPIPEKHYHALCRFDYVKDRAKATAYREAEVPFVVYNHPGAEEVVKKWSQPDYLEKLLGNEKYRSEKSHNNHFMYHNGSPKNDHGKGKNVWRPPTGNEDMSFKKFKAAALDCERRNCSNEEMHYYFRVTAMKPNHFIFHELPFFKPKASLFIKEPRQQRGIHCRFGMQAVIAENHYDGSRNVIGLFGGKRRYILAHPNQCKSMYLLPMGHPSGRHSGDACNFHPDCKDATNSVDWSSPDLAKWPKFKDLQANEVIMSPGDFLYLPTHWFHYIISLGLNYQCNTRSGRTETYTPDVKTCGFR
mmetsp:Transcript_54081/g.123240  ORF Transcript_54081/g.123240 Transcript_54081/m.123240 type:complete len:492 (+) Transcript_54081:150-1625(+)|eukprot:CAMPEP_0172591108 /NCGR_PEP_ID=MMETSP1068-20121228/9763_1 /TAXON_ID=35684 /ORGANISM="Pseudopedinella elastica, Strain CCMP716" /LENGTH=491 /DNA_ID=CAMNT_0013387331 /DNA_START=48 /DNA_END=1523 /DNA_ORIENTATION=-